MQNITVMKYMFTIKNSLQPNEKMNYAGYIYWSQRIFEFLHRTDIYSGEKNFEMNSGAG